MFVGFDYGSSNCVVGVYKGAEQVLLELEPGQRFLPSTLFAEHSTLVVDYVARHFSDNADKDAFLASRQGLLNNVNRIKSDLDLVGAEADVLVGNQAISRYIEAPEEGYFVKSPKSFLGATGLKPQQIAFFEDIVTAMMQVIKQRAESSLGQDIEHAVIGRPVNFQATGGEQSNRQACAILKSAARRAGFKEVELLFEPLAAGLDYEARLSGDQKVLVVDIGGGTSDCSFVQMGPSYRHKEARDGDFLAHSGARVGGNDLDIALSYHGLMPLLGLGSAFKSGRPLPSQPYWQACKINDLHMQSDFYSQENARYMKEIQRDVEDVARFSRLCHLQQNHQGHQLVRQGEIAKIALSEALEHNAELGFLSPGLEQPLTRDMLASAVDDALGQIVALARQAIKDAGITPDVIYLTGGSAQSPLVKAALKQGLGDITMVNGDHFSSVTSGLTQHAKRLFG